ncbi:MAG: efflux RND transporter periplasmic adaptor subunit [Rhodocyclaceae bacterium]|nr:efflux RND transporter periplasmic adaptor subunit [Rhodocyclaceae bacterium]
MRFALAGVVVAVALAAADWLGAPVPQGAVGVAAAAGEGGDGERKILYYRNPMGLPDTSPVPKKDSMGMDYIPVYEGEGPDDSGAVAVSPARMQTLGVRTARAEALVIDAAVRVVGRVEVNERAVQEVAPRFGGWIERLYVDATGDPVRRGQPLFEVYSPELVSARKELAIAERLSKAAAGGDATVRDGARRLAEAADERLRNWQLPANARARGDKIVFSSPSGGVVLDKKAVAGMRFRPGETIYRIADLSRVWVIADVYEQALARVAPGQRAVVLIDAYPERRFEAEVTYLYPTLNAPTRTTPVRLELDNREGLLRPGMFAHVELAAAGSEARLAVPLSAVIDQGHRQVVLLAEGEGRFRPQPVRLGIRGREYVEVLEGVTSGDEVVVAANFLIDSESNLKAALASFTEPEAAGPKRYDATGSIDELYVDENIASMNHDPIPDLQWPAMTMEFGMASPTVFDGIAPGEPIRFTFEDRGDGEFVIVEAQRQAVTSGSR